MAGTVATACRLLLWLSLEVGDMNRRDSVQTAVLASARSRWGELSRERTDGCSGVH